MSLDHTYSIYFAGELFSLKHLTGNALLGDEIENHPQSKYRCELPQDHEQRKISPIDLRNQDLLLLLQCDVGVFHFDGPELDSGTVVEYVFAKMLDIPSVIIRSDFRAAGDSLDPWNLMASGFPRSETILVHGMVSYQEERARSHSRSEAAVTASRSVAEQIVYALDRVRSIPPLLSRSEQAAAYSLARKFPGSGFEQCAPEPMLAEIIERKRQKGLL